MSVRNVPTLPDNAEAIISAADNLTIEEKAFLFIVLYSGLKMFYMKRLTIDSFQFDEENKCFFQVEDIDGFFDSNIYKKYVLPHINNVKKNLEKKLFTQLRIIDINKILSSLFNDNNYSYVSALKYFASRFFNKVYEKYKDKDPSYITDFKRYLGYRLNFFWIEAEEYLSNNEKFLFEETRYEKEITRDVMEAFFEKMLPLCPNVTGYKMTRLPGENRRIKTGEQLPASNT